MQYINYITREKVFFVFLEKKKSLVIIKYPSFWKMEKAPCIIKRNFKFVIKPSQSTAVSEVENEWAITFITNKIL